MPGKSKFDRLSTMQLREMWAWQDAGLSLEAAYAKVMESRRVTLMESQARQEASRGDAAYVALFGAETTPAAGGSLREANPVEATGDPYEALFGCQS